MSNNSSNISLKEGVRFAFGENWNNYLKNIDESAILESERYLKEWLQIDNLSGLRFVDIGCGSGLSSLAAYRLGASVYSLDYDPISVACTEELKKNILI